MNDYIKFLKLAFMYTDRSKVWIILHSYKPFKAWLKKGKRRTTNDN